jgi:tRNA A-37 threonylcarbamoyl transferase component Bud32
LNQASINTPRPVAAVENRLKGILAKSFFISVEIPDAKTADVYWTENIMTREIDRRLQRRREFIHALSYLFRTLHEHGIYHNDLKDANILVASQPAASSPRFYLLDLEGVKTYRRLSERRRIKNFVQLNRTLGRYLSRSDKLAFIINYLQTAYRSRPLTTQLIRRIVSESKRLDIAKGLQRISPNTVGQSTGV